MKGTLRVRELTQISKGITIPRNIRANFPIGTYVYEFKNTNGLLILEMKLIIKEDDKNEKF